MRLFTLIISALFVAIGVAMVFSGDPSGWPVAGFFGACLLIAVLDPWLPKPHLTCQYRVLITRDDVVCEQPRRRRESIRWEDVSRIWYVTTADGPWLPDQWLLLEGDSGGCAIPTEAIGFDGMWDELKQRFPGFDYGPFIRGGVDAARYLCWERQANRCA